MQITLEIVAILLSIVSFVVTVIGFFASLKFYRDGVTLQKNANEALVELSERTGAIQGQVDGMFQKTLDAAIQHRSVDENFDQLEEALRSTSDELVAEVSERLGHVGDRRKEEIRKVVREQMSDISNRVERARASTERVIQANDRFLDDDTGERLVFSAIQRSREAGIDIYGIRKEIFDEGYYVSLGRVWRMIATLIDRSEIAKEGEKFYVSR